MIFFPFLYRNRFSINATRKKEVATYGHLNDIAALASLLAAEVNFLAVRLTHVDFTKLKICSYSKKKLLTQR